MACSTKFTCTFDCDALNLSVRAFKASPFARGIDSQKLISTVPLADWRAALSQDADLVVTGEDEEEEEQADRPTAPRPRLRATDTDFKMERDMPLL